MMMMLGHGPDDHQLLRRSDVAAGGCIEVPWEGASRVLRTQLPFYGCYSVIISMSTLSGYCNFQKPSSLSDRVVMARDSSRLSVLSDHVSIV